MTTTTSIDLTAIRDATKDSSDDDDEGYSDSSSDGDWVKYKILPEREPEWDVDSFDGREFKVHPKVRELYPTQELYDEYYNDRLRAFESKGFIADPLSGIYDVDLDGPKQGYNSVRDFMADLANVCVKKFNETNKGNTLELVNVERVTESGGAKWKLYITFMAREYYEGPLVEYQAKVIKYLGNTQPPSPILCRPSPKPES